MQCSAVVSIQYSDESFHFNNTLVPISDATTIAQQLRLERSRRYDHSDRQSRGGAFVLLSS